MLKIQREKESEYNVFNFNDFYNELYEILIQEEEDKSEYINCLEENKNAQMALLDLRKRRIDSNDLSLSKFESLFNFDKKGALKKLFLQPVGDKHINFIEEQEISPEQIYNQRQKNKYLYIERILKNC